MFKRHMCAHDRAIARLGWDDRGATAVEYALLVSLIAAVIVAVVAVFGTDVASLFSSVETSLSSAASPH